MKRRPPRQSIFDRLRFAREEIHSIESDLNQAISDEEKQEIERRISALEAIANSKARKESS